MTTTSADVCRICGKLIIHLWFVWLSTADREREFNQRNCCMHCGIQLCSNCEQYRMEHLGLEKCLFNSTTFSE